MLGAGEKKKFKQDLYAIIYDPERTTLIPSSRERGLKEGKEPTLHFPRNLHSDEAIGAINNWLRSGLPQIQKEKVYVTPRQLVFLPVGESRRDAYLLISQAANDDPEIEKDLQALFLDNRIRYNDIDLR